MTAPKKCQFTPSKNHQFCSKAKISTPPQPPSPLTQKQSSQIYNERRASYKRAVSLLRKQYGAEIAIQRQKDAADDAKEPEAATQRKLERQRLKNIRSVKNALR